MERDAQQLSRRRLLMPWRWNRRIWCSFLGLTMATYFLSAELTDYIASHLHLRSELRDAIDIVYAPIRWCTNHSSIAASIVRMEAKLLDGWHQRPFISGTDTL